MSELKDYSILDIEAIDDERYKTESAPGKWVLESRVYFKSEADALIEKITKGAISMFRCSETCRGLDLKSPLGKIANIAFKHHTK